MNLLVVVSKVHLGDFFFRELFQRFLKNGFLKETGKWKLMEFLFQHLKIRKLRKIAIIFREKVYRIFAT